MSKFYKRLREIMAEKDYSVPKLAEYLNLHEMAIYSWKQKNSLPLLYTAIQIADLFDCSLEYLFGRIETDNYEKFKIPPPFYIHFREMMKSNHITRYELTTNKKIISSNHFTRWSRGATPSMNSIIKLADYFNLSIDEFIGRI